MCQSDYGTDLEMLERDLTILVRLRRDKSFLAHLIGGKPFNVLNGALAYRRPCYANDLKSDHYTLFVRYISRRLSNIAATHSDLPHLIMPPRIEQVAWKQCTPMLNHTASVQALWSTRSNPSRQGYV